MYRILLVDDEILVRDAIRENIDWGSMDCQLVGDCENGRQAMEFVMEHPVDISIQTATTLTILMSLSMTGQVMY